MLIKALRSASMITGVIALLSACGGGSSESSDNPPTAIGYGEFSLELVDPINCDALNLSAQNAAPTDKIAISGLPESFETLAVYIETLAGEGMLYPAPAAENQSAEFTVPLSPDINPDGAVTSLSVTNGTSVCPSVSFTIDPLPAAEGNFDDYTTDVLAEIVANIDAAASLAGTSYDELKALPGPSTNHTVSLFLAIQLLEAYLETPPEVSDEEKALFLRVAQQLNLLEELEALTLAIEELATNIVLSPVALPSTPSLAISLASLTESGQAQSASVASPPLLMQHAASSAQAAASSDCLILDPPIILIDGASELSQVMNNTLGTNMSETFSDLSSGLGVVSVFAPPPIDVVSDIGGIVATSIKLYGDYIDNIRPSHFTSFSFDVETPIYEDKRSPRSLWSNARASVASDPVSISRMGEEFAISVAGASPVGGRVITGVSTGATLFAGDLYNELLDQVDEANTVACVQVPAQSWGPFTDMAGPAWVKETYTGDAVTPVVFQEYEPHRIAESELRLDIIPEAFGGATMGAAARIQVEPVTVSLSPETTSVEATSRPVEFELDINAHQTGMAYYDVLFEPGAPAAPTFTDLGNGRYRVNAQTSASADDFPMLLKISRKPGTDTSLPVDLPREATARIYLGGSLEIIENTNCVGVGEDVDLEAFITGFENPDERAVSWNSNGGTIAAGSPTRFATFAANTTGTYTITAETPAPSSGQPALIDDIEIVVTSSCVRQFLAASNKTEVNGRQTCEGGILEVEDEIKFDEWGDNHAPVPASDYWYDRDESTTTQASGTSFERWREGETDRCEATFMSGSQTLDLSTRSDGSASWSVDAAVQGQCHDAATDSGNERRCYSAVSNGGLSHYIYIPITETGNYQFSMELSCEGSHADTLTGGLYTKSIYVNIYRYIDGDANRQELPNGEVSTTDPLIPFYFPLKTFSFSSCDEGGSTETKSFSMNLWEALGASGEDLVVMHYNVGTVLQVDTSDESDYTPQGDFQVNVKTKLEQLN